jgi:hypothetical protein
MPGHLSNAQWLMAMLAACGIGISKSGLPGISLLHVVIFAHLFSARESTGIVLPMLICGDIGAVLLFRRHARWSHVSKTLPPAVIGVAVGWWMMGWLPAAQYKPLIGLVVLLLALLQLFRNWQPGAFARVPHTHGFAWTMGLAAGITTMLANAAGPVMGLYLLAVSLPKAEFVGTSAWFFLLINVIKVPFSAQLGLITRETLCLNALMIPCIAGGLFLGRWIVARLPQKWFDTLVLAFAMVAALKLLGCF